MTIPRPKFSTALAAVLTVIVLPVDAVAQSTPAKNIDTRLCTLRLDEKSGNLVGLTWKKPNLEAIREPRLGENFRLLLPRANYEANYFNSSGQKVSRIETADDGVTLVYESLRNSREKVDVNVRYRIRAVEDHIEFSIEVDNRTDLPLAEVFFGVIGGQQGLGNRGDTESLVPGGNTNLAPGIFQSFPGAGTGGDVRFSIRNSGASFAYPDPMSMSWMELYDRKTIVGLYYGDHDPVSRLSALHFELSPFIATAMPGGNWPESSVVSGEAIGLTMGWLKFPYTRKGVFQSGPVALQVHQGDWHEGSRLYRAWFDRHFPVKRDPSWLRREMAWQSVIISNPEDEILYRFQDLPKLARDARKYGVTTFEILGWDVGGIDRGYPQYTPDPRLGSRDEFRSALAEIKRIGVHPLIFANVAVADTGTALYKESLHRYAATGRWADDLPLMGWGEGTISARMGLTRHNMTTVSPSHPGFRKLLVDQFAGLAVDGADGLQLDKSNAHLLLDFNPAVPASPDRSLVEGQLETFKEILRKGREIRPDFSLAGETLWDRAFPQIDVSYMRLNTVDMPSPALRYTFPEWTGTIFAENPGDFNLMSNGMRYGLVWDVAAHHYSDSMDAPSMRPLSAYVRELIRIRGKHKDLLFHGRFRDTMGAEVKAGSAIRYSVFQGMDGKGKACVVVNYGDKEETAGVSWTGKTVNPVEILQPFKPDIFEKLPAKIRLAPHTCAVLIEN